MAVHAFVMHAMTYHMMMMWRSSTALYNGMPTTLTACESYL